MHAAGKTGGMNDFMRQPSALELVGISVAFDKRQVLHDVSLTARVGRIHALLSHNGAGKSTAFKAALGLVPVAAGQVRVLGRPLNTTVLKDVGVSINGPALYGQLSARDNVRVHQLALGLPKRDVDRVLRVVGLGDVGRKKARTFSTGMKGRLALACALLGTPQVLLLDEPQNGLDPQGVTDLRRLLREFVDSGWSVLISSHQLAEVARIADDVTVIHDGRTVFSGTADDFAPGGDLEAQFFHATGGLS